MKQNNTSSNRAEQYDIEDLPRLGWITWTERGEENFYFVMADGSIGFVKLG